MSLDDFLSLLLLILWWQKVRVQHLFNTFYLEFLSSEIFFFIFFSVCTPHHHHHCHHRNSTKSFVSFFSLDGDEIYSHFFAFIFTLSSTKKRKIFFLCAFSFHFQGLNFLVVCFCFCFWQFKRKKKWKTREWKNDNDKKKVLMKLLNEKQKLSYFIELHNIITSQMKSLSFYFCLWFKLIYLWNSFIFFQSFFLFFLSLSSSNLYTRRLRQIY